MAPMKVSAGVPTSKRRHHGEHALGRQAPPAARSSGAASASGRPVTSQWASTLASTTTSSGAGESRRRSRDPSSWSAWNSRSRPIRVASRARDPQDGGADARQQVEIGPEREGHQRHDGEEEHQPHGARAADPRRKLQVADQEGPEGAGHARRLGDRVRARWRVPARRARPSGAWVVATTMPPPRAMRLDQAAQASPARPDRAPRSARREARAAAAPRAAAPAPRAGAGRPTDRRPAVGARGRGRRPRGPRAETAPDRRGNRGRRRGFRRPSGRLSARRDGRRSGGIRASVRSPAPSSRIAPAAGRRRPARISSSEDLPAPLRPSTTSASPRPERERNTLEDAALAPFASQIFDAQTQPARPLP